MYFSVGSPKTISDLKLRPADANVARRATEIAVLDDEPFVRTEQLRTHGFLVTELGGDLKSVSQIDRYPIVVCDVRGVGKSFGSAAEGAHVVSEIRKAYPDKYLIAYTGMTYDVIVTEKLQAASVDKIMQKDAAVDAWVQLLDTAIKEVTDPKRRWLRIRHTLLEVGVDIYSVAQLEQAYVRSIESGRKDILIDRARRSNVDSRAMDLLVKFAGSALASLISMLAKAAG